MMVQRTPSPPTIRVRRARWCEAMKKRRRISTKQRLAVFTAADGVCHICAGKIGVGERWEVSHLIPLELGGADDASNTRPAHYRCHRDLTAKEDVPAIAKAKRREAKHKGAARPKGKIARRAREEKPKSDKLPLPARRGIYVDV